MAAQPTSNATSAQALSDTQLLAKFQERCRHLNEALEAERAKTSKLRRYISRLNTKSTPPAEYHQEQPGLQNLVSEQAKLIEQLYAENQSLQEVTKTRNQQNHLLVVANEKLKARIIELRRQVREYAERQLASKPAQPAANHAHEMIEAMPNRAEGGRSWLPSSVGKLLNK